MVTATGMAAVSVVLHALLAPGDRLLAPHDCYGGSWRLFSALAAKGLFEFDTCDFTDAARSAALERRPQADVVWIETPSNPLLRITDLETVSAAAHARRRAGRRGQHLPVAGAAAADRARRRRRGPLDDQIHQWP